MGRTTPASFSSSTIPTTSPISLTLTIMAFASSITIIFTLCMSHHRKSSTPKSQPSLPSIQSTKTPHVAPSSLASKQSTKTPHVVPPPPPPPPIQLQKQKQDISIMGPLSPRRRLYVSLSMRFHEGYLSKIRSNNKREMHQKGKAFFEPEAAAEDSVWSKKIILGERCRVPSDDDEEFVMYDETGNKRRNYHPKAPRSLPVSRTNSFVVDDDLAPAKVASLMYGGGL